MSYKLPPQPSKPHPSLPLPKTQAIVGQEAESAAQAISAARLAESAKRGYLGARAVGIAVIVGFGAVLGAQLKERRDLNARSKLQKQSASEAPVMTGSEELVETNTIEPPIKTQDGKNAPQQVMNMGLAGVGERGMSYNERQIAFLQDRRGVLMKQKFDLEKKIMNVREKKRRAEEMESRRSTGAEAER